MCGRGGLCNEVWEGESCSLVPRPSTPPAFDRLQYAKAAQNDLGPSGTKTFQKHVHVPLEFIPIVMSVSDTSGSLYRLCTE